MIEMRYKVNVIVDLKEGLLDAAGNVTKRALERMGYKNVQEVKIGKINRLEIKAKSEEELEKQVREMCNNILTNPLVEKYRIEVVK
jgi:phosphoribosylformylglycinamidine synthase